MNRSAKSRRLPQKRPSPEKPGVYQVNRDEQTVYALAVNLAAEESPLESLDGEVLTDRLAGGRAMYFRETTGDGGHRDDAWKWFAVACVICMLAEIGTLLAFRT